jgi:hypothetical protein
VLTLPFTFPCVPEFCDICPRLTPDAFRSRYKIALRDKLLDVKDDLLAPQLCVGDSVMCFEGGESEASTVLHVNESSRC